MRAQMRSRSQAAPAQSSRSVRRVLALAVALSGALLTRSAPAAAQTCGAAGLIAGYVQDACVKSADIFRFLAPQVGVALSGGNAMLGEGGALGGWGKRSAVLRVTAVEGFVPENDVSFGSSTQPISSNFGATRVPLPVPSLDVGIGLYRGVPVGLTNVGGVDLLLGITVIPSVSRDQVSVESDGGGVAASVGVRLGLLQESALVPGVAVSVSRRRLPTSSTAYFTANDTIAVNDTKVSTTAVRLTANKRFGLFALGGGIGRDNISASTSAVATLNERVSGQPVRAVVVTGLLEERTSRNTAFLNLSLGLPFAQLVLEVGQSQAGDIRETINTFGDRRANEGYRYGSLGFGFRF